MPFPDLTSLRHESLRLACLANPCLANHCLWAKDQAPRSNQEQKAKISTIEGHSQPALTVCHYALIRINNRTHVLLCYLVST